MAEDERKIYEIERSNPGLFGTKREVRDTAVRLTTWFSGDGGGGSRMDVDIPKTGTVVKVRDWNLDNRGFSEYEADLREGYIGFNAGDDAYRNYVRLERRIPYEIRKRLRRKK